MTFTAFSLSAYVVVISLCFDVAQRLAFSMRCGGVVPLSHLF